MAHVTRVNILQEPPRAVQNISQLLENFFEKAEQENYPNATFERRAARNRQVSHIALKQRRRVPRYASRRPKGKMECMVTQNMLNHSRYEPICFSLLKNGWATRIPGRATRAPTPQAKAFGRIPVRKNVAFAPKTARSSFTRQIDLKEERSVLRYASDN